MLNRTRYVAANDKYIPITVTKLRADEQSKCFVYIAYA